jgi:hypothetical protein
MVAPVDELTCSRPRPRYPIPAPRGTPAQLLISRPGTGAGRSGGRVRRYAGRRAQPGISA